MFREKSDKMHRKYAQVKVKSGVLWETYKMKTEVRFQP